jgi:hyperosmotically inducible periplasmic protein
MKTAFGLKLVIPALVLGMIATTPVFGQEATDSASQSMHQAGSSAGDAASSTGDAVKHVYQGAATAMSDTAITAKVKTALHGNKVTNESDIHVETIAGVVTLTGTASSSDASATASQLTAATNGVTGVKNELTKAPTPS